MKAIVLALALTGCSSLQYAGNATYSVAPVITPNGDAVCCAVTVHNGKEIGQLEAHIVKDGDKYVVDLKESNVKAFEGQRIVSGALKEAVEDVARAAAMSAIAPMLPALAPVAGAALASPGIGAAAAGAAGAIAVDRLVK